MTAIILNIADFRASPASAAPVKRTHGRRPCYSDETAEVLKQINRGYTITDIGQIDHATKRVLKRLVAKGYIYEDVDHTFPKAKRCWYGAAEIEMEIA